MICGACGRRAGSGLIVLVRILTLQGFIDVMHPMHRGCAISNRRTTKWSHVNRTVNRQIKKRFGYNWSLVKSRDLKYSYRLNVYKRIYKEVVTWQTKIWKHQLRSVF